MKRTGLTRIMAAVLAAATAVSLYGCRSSGSQPDSAGDTAGQELILASAPAETAETTLSPETTQPALPEEEALDETQKNSIAMLNYLAVLSQEINDSKNSRMFLEEAYASLINNTNPEKVNELTQSYLASMLDIIENYRMIAVKRERLQYIYEQNKAKALKNVMSDPVGLLSAAKAINPVQLAASAIYMAVDAYGSYQTYNLEIAQEFLEDGWTLDDEEAENLHDSRKRAFTFMVEMVREDDLPGKLALSESAVEKFVFWKDNTNVHQKIQFFESERDTYEVFGSYWIELADCYYEQGDYEKCLDAIRTYEDFSADIFRKDYYFAQELPKVIVAAREIYEDEAYIPVAEHYLSLLMENTESTEWSLRYFASQMYLDLYAKIQDSEYLDTAYEITLNNVNNLVTEQRARNQAYLEDVREETIPEGATKEEKNQIKDYNKWLHDQREVELPPVYEPLELNCELLFALADRRAVSHQERVRIDGILHGNGEVLFLSAPMENRYVLEPEEMRFEGVFNKEELTIPVSCVNERSVIKVTVTGSGKTTVYDDWTVQEVEREGKWISGFSVTYENEEIEEQQWDEDAEVKVEIFPEESAQTADVVLNFQVSKISGRWILPDAVTFEQVSGYEI